MRRPVVDLAGKLLPLAAGDPKAFSKAPGLRGFFFDATYDEGLVTREPGQLIIRPTASAWQWILKEPSACTQLTLQAPTWDEITVLAEALLLDPNAPWIVDKWAEARKPKPVTRRRTP